MKKIFCLFIFATLFSACGGIREIKLRPKYKPNKQPIYMLSTGNYQFKVRASGGGLLGAAIAHSKQKKIRKAVATINPVKYLDYYAKKRFKKMRVNYTLLTNKKINPAEVPIFKAPNEELIDRNFSKIKDKIESNLVLELRLIEFRIKQNSGLGGDYNVIVTVQGILHDLKTGKKVWQYAAEEKMELDGLSLSEVIANNGWQIRSHLKTVLFHAVSRVYAALK